MDRRLALSAVIALLISTALLLDDMRVIRLPFFSDKKENTETSVGKVRQIQNHVRKRAQEDILWSKSRTEDPVYYFDSILTLSESRAELELFEKSKIEISENTLIMIEPGEVGKDGQLRLRFKRGALGVGKLNANASVAAGDWEVNLDAGTQFQMRASADDSFELEVEEGSASISKNGESQKVNRHEALQLKPNGVQRLKLSDDLSWETPRNTRIYTHQNKDLVPLSWKGDAQGIIATTNNSDQQTSAISRTDHNTKLELPVGTHFLRLQSEDKVSELLKVEVARAPIVHLYHPLPRDRVRLGEKTIFSWKKIESLSKYKIQIAGDSDFKHLLKESETADSSIDLEIKNTGRFFWRVVGIDQDLHEVPPAYSNEIYFVENPLEAPEVVPHERQPSSSFYRLPVPIMIAYFFVESVSADSLDVEFSWKSVPGATRYSLEIDDDPYFQSPEVMTTANENKFVWRQAPRKTVYWRVAGDSEGRMGLFSPVQKIDLAHLQSRSVAGEDYSVTKLPRKLPKLKAIKPTDSSNVPEMKAVDVPQQTPVPQVKTADPEVAAKPQYQLVPPRKPIEIKTESEKPVQAQEPLPPAPVRREEPKQMAEADAPTRALQPLPEKGGYVWYGFGYRQRTLNTNHIHKAELSSLSAANLGGEVHYHHQDYDFKMRGFFTYEKWKPKNKEKYPFQDDFNEWNAQLDLMGSVLARRGWAGLTVKKATGVTKKDFENMALKDIYFFGPTVEYVQPISNVWTITGTGSFLFGAGGVMSEIGVFGAYSVQEIPGAFIGVKASAEIFKAETSGSSIRVLFPFGYEW